MRGVCFAVLALALAVPAARAESPGYRAAVAAFDRELTLPERMRLQVRLIAGGYTNNVPTEHLGLHVFEAIKAYQRDIGFVPTGQFTNPVAERLRDDTQSLSVGLGRK